MVEKVQDRWDNKQHSLKEALPCWLALNRLPGFGPRALLHLMGDLGGVVSHLFLNHRKPTSELNSWLTSHGYSNLFDWAGVDLDLAWLEQDASHHVLALDFPDYPERLRAIESAPCVLFVKGDVRWLSLPQIAIVGSRHPTPLGREQSYGFAQGLVIAGLTVTSGLALGIDGAAHQGALDANGGTVAVMGHGLDQIYPKSHAGLAEAIVAQGALVSEFPIGTAPLPQHFPRRNRIISGLAGGVLVVEAALKSGSLITARCALEQGREVFALPGSVQNPTAKGCHYLIREGAQLVETVDEIVRALTPCYTGWQPEHATREQVVSKAKPEVSDNLENLLLIAIDETVTSVDRLIQRTGLSLQEVTSVLLMLELAGQVQAVSGGYVRLV